MSGMFGGASKQKSSGDFKVTKDAAAAEREMLMQLRKQISGEGESIANLQYEKAIEDAMKANMATTASARGVSGAGLLNRNVANANAELMNGMAQNSAINKLQEQEKAQNLIAQVTGGQRGVALQSGVANQNAEANYRNQNMQIAGNIGAGAAMAFSDEDLKTNKKKTKKEALEAVEEFLNCADSHEYNYKGGDTVDHLGVMAQDLETSKIGKQMVKNTPAGKIVDYGEGFSAMMAGLSEMNKRIKNIEKKG